MKPVRLSKEELKSQFKTGERFAVRILALQKKGLSLTEALIEEALRKPDLLDVLLGEELLADPTNIPAGVLKAKNLACEGAVLGLAEELLTEEEPKQLRPSSPFDFSAGELDGLRLTILTSVDPKQKIEALRKLSLSHAGADEKGVIFLKALNDVESDVRREAIAALQQVGLNPEVADALRALGEGSSGQKRLALEKLGVRLEACSSSEKAVVFSVLVSQIRQERETDVTRALIDTLGRLADIISSSADLRLLLVRTAIKILTDHLIALSQPVLRLFEQLAPGAPPEAALEIWSEIEPLSDRRLKALFLSVIGKFPHDAALRRRMASAIARTLSVTHGEEIESRQFLDVGRMLGEDQVRAFLEHLPEVKDEYVKFYVSAIDFTANSTTVSDAVLQDVGHAFLRLLETKGKVVRRSILESSICHSPRMPAAIKERLASNLLTNLHLDRTGRLAELTSVLIHKIGFAALPALQEAAAHSAHEIERRVAIELIGEIGGADRDEAAKLPQLIKFLRKLEKSSEAPRGALWIALGRLCANPRVDPETAAEIFKEFRGSLKRKKAGFEMILALGHLASAPTTPAKDSCDVALDMMQALEGKMPDPVLSQENTEEGVRLVISNDALAYTEFIPNLLAALSMIYESGKLPETVRSKLIDRLIRRWDDLIEFREIWAPGTVIDLARSFCAMARHASTPSAHRYTLFEAILRYCRNTTICRILADTLHATDEDSDEFAEIVGRFVDNLLDLHRHPDYQQPEDKRAVTAALARVAMNRRLSPSKRDSDRLREQLVELVIEQSGPQQRELARLLREIARSPHLSAALRSRLQSVVES